MKNSISLIISILVFSTSNNIAKLNIIYQIGYHDVLTFHVQPIIHLFKL